MLKKLKYLYPHPTPTNIIIILLPVIDQSRNQ